MWGRAKRRGAFTAEVAENAEEKKGGNAEKRGMVEDTEFGVRDAEEEAGRGRIAGA